MEQKMLSNKHILYVEDDDFLANLIIQKLKAEGAKVAHAHNPDEAFSAMREGQFNVLLLDLLLPGMSGLDVVEHLNAEFNLSSSKTPVIVFSNLAVTADIERSKMLGVDRYLIKANVAPGEIARTIKEVVDECEHKRSSSADSSLSL